LSIKYVYDVVYDSAELLEEGRHTFPQAVTDLYDSLVSEGKIISYSFIVNINTMSRTNTITYANINAREEHRARYKIINPTDEIVAGRTITNQYLEDDYGKRTYV
jgi:hypothetical protein